MQLKSLNVTSYGNKHPNSSTSVQYNMVVKTSIVKVVLVCITT
jgi:hypothetical protein